jgi:DNA-binding MarR family transcriptional regulator
MTTEKQEDRQQRVRMIEQVIRQITWHGHKQSIHTLSREDISLTMPQMMTLFAIRGVGACRMSDLAELTQQSAGTLTGIVDRLIEDGLVGRIRASEDRRVVQVALTPDGERRLAQVEQVRIEDMARVLHYFSAEQLAHLEELMHLLLAGIQDLLQESLTTTAIHDGVA